MKWLARIFTWWNGQTLNTALHTLLFGKFVGKDEYGNRYYRAKGGRIGHVHCKDASRGKDGKRGVHDPGRLVWLASSHV